MVRLRAKTKVRYAILLAFVGLFGVYIGLRIAKSTEGKLWNEAPKMFRAMGDITRRSFTAKWHDGRGLLNEISETKKHENIRAKFERHLTDHQSFENRLVHGNDDKKYGNIHGDVTDGQDIRMEVDTVEGQDEYESDELTEVPVTTASIHGSVGHKILTPERKKPETNERNDGIASKEDYVSRSIPKKTNITIEWERRALDRNDKDKRKFKSEEPPKVNQKMQNAKGRMKDDRKKTLKKDLVEDIKKSNRTIFDPNDHILTYYNLNDQNHFAESLLDESRKFDSYWAPEFPLTPQDAIVKYGDRIPSWERFEIMHYPKVFYLGLGANKTQLTTNATANFGYDYFHKDEDEGHYRVVVGDHIGYRYEILKFLGSGTFGAVVLARDWSQPTARNVALKIMHFDENDKYIVRELNMMQLIERNATNRDYFSRMLASFDFRNHKCIVLELLGSTLHRHKHGPVKNMDTFRRYARDILTGLHYLKELNIAHADMKPANIMFMYGKNNKSQGQLLKIADFGIGCIPGDKAFFKCPAYYVQTRYYRAPEVILSIGITPAVDMFSVGVIFAEFFIGNPPFYGESETDHFAAMMEVLGLPPTHMIATSPRKKIYQRAICYETENGFRRRPYRKPLTKVLKGIDADLFDLIARCLEYDPKLRMTPEEALRHPFLTGVEPEEKLKTPLSIQRFLGKI